MLSILTSFIHSDKDLSTPLFFHMVKYQNKLLCSPRTTDVTCLCDLWMMQIDNPTHVGSYGSGFCPSSVWVKFYIFRQSCKLTSHDLWPHEHVKVPNLPGLIYITSINYVLFQSFFFQMRWILHLEHISQLDLWWPLTLVYKIWLHEHTMDQTLQNPSLVPIRLPTFQMRPNHKLHHKLCRVYCVLVLSGV